MFFYLKGSIIWLEKQTHMQSSYDTKQKISALTEAPRSKGEWGFGGVWESSSRGDDGDEKKLVLED